MTFALWGSSEVLLVVARQRLARRDLRLSPALLLLLLLARKLLLRRLDLRYVAEGVHLLCRLHYLDLLATSLRPVVACDGSEVVRDDPLLRAHVLAELAVVRNHEHATTELLRPAPRIPYPATVTETRTVSAQALVSWRGNQYSVAPQLAHSTVVVSQRLGDPYIDIATPTGVVVARHTLAAAGAGVMVRDDVHVAALERAALAAFTTARPHRRKERIPISPEATALLPAPAADLNAHSDVVIDLAAYAAAAAGRNTLT